MIDVTQYDWNQWYSDRNSWPTSENVFLADAVMRLGRDLVFPWDEGDWLAVNLPPAPDIPHPDEAFVGDAPLPHVHASWAHRIEGWLSFEDYSAKIFQSHQEQSFMATFRRDLLSGKVLLNPEAFYTEMPTLTYEHWEHAYFDAAIINSAREHMVRFIPILGKAIAHLAVTGRIRTILRPVLGGEETDVGREIWNVNSALPRLASCALNINDVFTPNAEPTHHIFFHGNGLDEVLRAYAARRQLRWPVERQL